MKTILVFIMTLVSMNLMASSDLKDIKDVIKEKTQSLGTDECMVKTRYSKKKKNLKVTIVKENEKLDYVFTINAELTNQNDGQTIVSERAMFGSGQMRIKHDVTFSISENIENDDVLVYLRRVEDLAGRKSTKFLSCKLN